MTLELSDNETTIEASEICKKLGFDLTTAVNMFLRQVTIYNGLPFDVTLNHPNDETIEAMREAELNGGDRTLSKPYSSTKELMEALNA